MPNEPHFALAVCPFFRHVKGCALTCESPFAHSAVRFHFDNSAALDRLFFAYCARKCWDSCPLAGILLEKGEWEEDTGEEAEEEEE